MIILHGKNSSGGVVESLGPYEIESLISANEEGQVTAYRVLIKPDQETSESYHKIAEEIYYIVAGKGTAYLDGKVFNLEPGDFLRLPPGTRHRFITREEPLEMLDIHSPGSRPDRDVYFKGDTPDGFSAAE